MASVLLCTEADRDDGALRRLALLDEALRKRGHETRYVLSETGYVGSLKQVPQERVLAGPHPGIYPRAADHVDTVSAMMLRSGLQNWPKLAVNVALWRNLAGLACADLVVLDSAPTATMALSGTYKTLQIGAGARIPPARGLAVALGPESEAATLGGQVRDSLIAAINRVRGQFRETAIGGIDDIFITTSRLVCCLAEFDPYLKHREERIVGPLEQLPAAAPVDKHSVGALAFLDPDYEFGQIAMTNIMALGRQAKVFAPGMSPRAVAVLQEKGVAVVADRLPRLEDWSGSALAIHHGDLRLAEELLALGRPQIVLPRDPEQRAVANALVTRGIAVNLSTQKDIEALTAVVERLADDEDLRARAYAWGRTVQDDAGAAGLPKVVAECEALMAAQGSGQ